MGNQPSFLLHRVVLLLSCHCRTGTGTHRQANLNIVQALLLLTLLLAIICCYSCHNFLDYAGKFIAYF